MSDSSDDGTNDATGPGDRVLYLNFSGEKQVGPGGSAGADSPDSSDAVDATDATGTSDAGEDDGPADTESEDAFDVAYLKPLNYDFSGELLGHRYLLEKRISVGTVSTLYRAKDRRLGTTVAVKVLHPEYNKNSEFARRFAQEARIASQVRHQNLVPAFDFGWLGGKRFIVFELVEGPTVHDLITEEPLPWRRATALICDLLAGLAALHEAGVAHRDISPVNCLVDTAHGERGRLIDLGYARLLDKRGRLDVAMQPKSESKIIYGTEGYIELERLNGGRGDYRADIFSIGAVWYAMLMGRTPLDPAGLDEAFTPIVLPLPMPEPLVAVLRGALAPRKERHHSAVSMLGAIRDALQQIDAPQHSASSRPAWARWVAAIVPAVAVGGIAAALLPTATRCPEPTLAAATTREAESPPMLVQPAPEVAQRVLPQPASVPAPPIPPPEDEPPPAAPPTWQTSDVTVLANSPPKRSAPEPSRLRRRPCRVQACSRSPARYRNHTRQTRDDQWRPRTRRTRPLRRGGPGQAPAEAAGALQAVAPRPAGASGARGQLVVQSLQVLLSPPDISPCMLGAYAVDSA